MAESAVDAVDLAGEPAYLRIEHVGKRFDDTWAVRDVSLTIGQHEIFALLGSSGCGKSTLLRIIAGLEMPSTGRIVLDGEDLAEVPAHRRPTNMMFQSYALFPHLSVAGNVAFGLHQMRPRMARGEIEARVDEMLDLVQMKAFARRAPHELSGGQQQRVALARSLAREPKLLLLDEPLAALDKKIRRQTQLELVSLIRRVGVTCIVVTHDQEEAMTMSNRIGITSPRKYFGRLPALQSAQIQPFRSKPQFSGFREVGFRSVELCLKLLGNPRCPNSTLRVFNPKSDTVNLSPRRHLERYQQRTMIRGDRFIQHVASHHTPDLRTQQHIVDPLRRSIRWTRRRRVSKRGIRPILEKAIHGSTPRHVIEITRQNRGQRLLFSKRLTQGIYLQPTGFVFCRGIQMQSNKSHGVSHRGLDHGRHRDSRLAIGRIGQEMHIEPPDWPPTQDRLSIVSPLEFHGRPVPHLHPRQCRDFLGLIHLARPLRPLVEFLQGHNVRSRGHDHPRNARDIDLSIQPLAMMRVVGQNSEHGRRRRLQRRATRHCPGTPSQACKKGPSRNA
jgi:ABC-type nitrate/sulfonate/bicarbonate transport system ATPase subunit